MDIEQTEQELEKAKATAAGAAKRMQSLQHSVTHKRRKQEVAAQQEHKEATETAARMAAAAAGDAFAPSGQDKAAVTSSCG